MKYPKIADELNISWVDGLWYGAWAPNYHTDFELLTLQGSDLNLGYRLCENDHHTLSG